MKGLIALRIVYKGMMRSLKVFLFVLRFEPVLFFKIEGLLKRDSNKIGLKKKKKFICSGDRKFK